MTCPDCNLGDIEGRQLHTSRCPRNPLNAPTPSRLERIRDFLLWYWRQVSWPDVGFAILASGVAALLVWGFLTWVESPHH